MSMALLPPPEDFDEVSYLIAYPEVYDAVARGVIGSGWQHFALYGWKEGRWAGLKNTVNPHTGLPAPPPHLRFRVHGSLNLPGFISSSLDNAKTVTATMLQAGCCTAHGRVLDFGCG